METKWYHNVWAKYAMILAVIAGLSTGGSYLISGVNWWNSQQNIPKKVQEMEVRDSIILLKLDFVIEYIENKKKSFAVGFRVAKTVDEHTGEPRWVRQYRDWKGRWHPIYLDLELTELYGIEQYYYIDSDTQERKWCL